MDAVPRTLASYRDALCRRAGTIVLDEFRELRGTTLLAKRADAMARLDVQKSMPRPKSLDAVMPYPRRPLRVSFPESRRTHRRRAGTALR